MRTRKQSSTDYPIVFLLVSSADGVTPVVGASPTVTLSKNGAAFAAASGAVSEIGSGSYALAGDAGDRDTVGEMVVHVEASGCVPVDALVGIVPWEAFVDLTTTRIGYLDAAVSTRSSHSAADVAALVPDSSANATAVWASGTRTLTSFGTLVADIVAAFKAITNASVTTAGSWMKYLKDQVGMISSSGFTIASPVDDEGPVVIYQGADYKGAVALTWTNSSWGDLSGATITLTIHACTSAGADVTASGTGGSNSISVELAAASTGTIVAPRAYRLTVVATVGGNIEPKVDTEVQVKVIGE